MRSCDRPPWYLSLSMSLIMRMSMRCCGICPDPQRARGYAQRVGSYATSAPNGVSVRPPSTSRRRGLGHVTEMTGHVPETVGHDAENPGHALPKYAAGRGCIPGNGPRPPADRHRHTRGTGHGDLARQRPTPPTRPGPTETGPAAAVLGRGRTALEIPAARPGPQDPGTALPVRHRPLLARSGAPAHGPGPRLLRQRPGGRPARGPAGRHGTRSATPARALRLRDQAACHRRRCAGAALRRPAYRAGRDRPGGAAPRTATTAATANAMPPRQTSPTDRAPSSWRNCVPAARAWT